MTRSVDHDVKAAVERLVRERFSGADVDHIIVSECDTVDGEGIVDVVVILKSQPDVSKLKGLTRTLWSDLVTRRAGFPVLSFRTTAEHSRLMSAAA